MRLGFTVLKPLSDGTRYDLVFEAGGAFVRAQCKWAVVRGDVVVVNCQSSRRSPDGYQRSTYTAAETDIIAAYTADVDRSFLIAAADFENHPSLSLRLGLPRNNQRRRVRWADDYDFGATLPRYLGGAIAQLGERLHGMQEVAGSSPAGSIREAAQSGLFL